MNTLLGTTVGDVLGWVFIFGAIASCCVWAYLRSDDRRVLIIKWLCSAVLILSFFFIAWLHNIILSLLYIIPAVLLAFLWLPNIGSFIMKPMTDSWDGGSDELKPKPFYFTAEAKRQQGRYEEAVEEIRHQLEQFPGDIEGMTRLATIQAEDMHDLPGATATLNELLLHPGLSPGKAIGALQTLGDYQLNLGRDPAAARASFERIIQLFPNTPASHAAEQRIARLEGVTEAREFRENVVFKVPNRERDLGLKPRVEQPDTSEEQAADQAADYVRQLEKYPYDTEAREKLAMLYAEELNRADLAVDQLEQLAALTNATPKQTAHWLGLLATLHIQHRHDVAAAESALSRIMDRFPQSAVAGHAQARIMTLQGELKAAATVTSSKAIGAYEKDLGLKAGTGSPKFGR